MGMQQCVLMQQVELGGCGWAGSLGMRKGSKDVWCVSREGRRRGCDMTMLCGVPCYSSICLQSLLASGRCSHPALT